MVISFSLELKTSGFSFSGSTMSLQALWDVYGLTVAPRVLFFPLFSFLTFTVYGSATSSLPPFHLAPSASADIKILSCERGAHACHRES